ncbi:MAG: hypothetical protein SOZ40_05560 [Ezakiella sp.]|nr:hypothetical protein [Ezakiella sp.]
MSKVVKLRDLYTIVDDLEECAREAEEARERAREVDYMRELADYIVNVNKLIVDLMDCLDSREYLKLRGVIEEDDRN